MIIKKCEFCKKEYRTQTKKRKYCSQKCFRAWQRSGILKGREATGKPFEKGHKTNRGKTPWNKGTKGAQVAWNKGLVMKSYYDKEQYERFIQGCIKGGIACCLKVANNNNRTKIEIALEQIVEDLGIRYFTQYPLLGITVADIYLPDNHIAIYADGDYWHNYPHGTKKDHAVTTELQNAHIKVMRFWECDIKKDISKIKEIIREAQRL